MTTDIWEKPHSWRICHVTVSQLLIWEALCEYVGTAGWNTASKVNFLVGQGHHQMSDKAETPICYPKRAACQPNLVMHIISAIAVVLAATTELQINDLYNLIYIPKLLLSSQSQVEHIQG